MGQLSQIFKNRNAIWEGLRNKIFKQEHVEEVYTERKEICNACNHVDVEGERCAVPGTSPCCGLCGCSLSLKLRALSEACPDNRWQPVVTKQEEDMINEQIDLTNKHKDDPKN